MKPISERFLNELAAFSRPDPEAVNLRGFGGAQGLRLGSVCQGWLLPSDRIVTQHCRFDESGRGDHACVLHVWDPAARRHLAVLHGLTGVRRSFYESTSSYHEADVTFGPVWELADGRIASEVAGDIDSDGIQYSVGTVAIWNPDDPAQVEIVQEVRGRVEDGHLVLREETGAPYVTPSGKERARFGLTGEATPAQPLRVHGLWIREDHLDPGTGGRVRWLRGHEVYPYRRVWSASSASSQMNESWTRPYDDLTPETLETRLAEVRSWLDEMEAGDAGLASEILHQTAAVEGALDHPDDAVYYLHRTAARLLDEARVVGVLPENA